MTVPPEGLTAAPEFATCTLDDDPWSVTAARRFARSTLFGWGMDGLVDNVASVISELVANALRHGMACRPDPAAATGPVVLSLFRRGPEIVCAVFDPCTGVPRIRESEDLAESGRGLRIIESLSDGWGWSTPGPLGKAVWSRFSAVADTVPATAYEPGADSQRRLPAPLLDLVESLTGCSPPRLQAAA